jgi:hypothetical protein
MSNKFQSWLDDLGIELPNDLEMFEHEYLSKHDIMMLQMDYILYKIAMNPKNDTKLVLAAIAQAQHRNDAMHRRKNPQPVEDNKPVLVSWAVTKAIPKNRESAAENS